MEGQRSTEALKEYRRKVDAGEVAPPAPPEYNLIRKAKKNPGSMKSAVQAFCFSCMGGTEHEYPDGGWRLDIANCTAPTCPLFNWRPFQNLSKEDIEADRQQSEAEKAEAELEEAAV